MFGPRGEQLDLSHVIIIATIYRVALYRAGEMVTMIELLLPGWLAGDDAGVRRCPWAHLRSGVGCPIWRYAGSRVVSGRGVWPVAGRVNPFMR